MFISHDLGVVRYIADRVAIMYLGRICEIGSVEEVYTNPKHPYTEYLLQSVPKMRVPNGDKEDLQQSLQEANEIKVEKEKICVHSIHVVNIIQIFVSRNFQNKRKK